MTTSWAPSPIAKQYITDKQLIGTDWLRSIANFWQLICVYKLDSIYSQTSANLRVIAVSLNQTTNFCEQVPSPKATLAESGRHKYLKSVTSSKPGQWIH